MKDTTDMSTLVAAYIARYANEYSHDNGMFKREDINFWAFQSLEELARHHPEKAYAAILEILASTEDEYVLCNLAAGPLEDLLAYHGPDLSNRLKLRRAKISGLGTFWMVFGKTLLMPRYGSVFNGFLSHEHAAPGGRRGEHPCLAQPHRLG